LNLRSLSRCTGAVVSSLLLAANTLVAFGADARRPAKQSQTPGCAAAGTCRVGLESSRREDLIAQLARAAHDYFLFVPVRD